MKRLLDPFRDDKSSVQMAKETAQVMLDITQSSKYQSINELTKLIKRAEKLIVEENTLEFTVENVVRKIVNLVRDVNTNESAPGQNPRAKGFSTLKHIFEKDDTLADENVPTEPTEDKEVFKAKRAKIIDAITDLVTELESINDAINEFAANHINSGDMILTYGYSSTIKQFLVEAKSARSFEVIVLEGEQKKSGSRMVQELAREGITATLIPFSGAFAFMSRINKVFIGAHAMMKNGGVLSRTGMLMLAMAAKMYSVPVIVIAAAIKLTTHFPFEQNSFNELLNPQEVWENKTAANDNETVLATRFDYVPPEYINLYITDHGEHTPAYIYRLFNEFYSRDD